MEDHSRQSMTMRNGQWSHRHGDPETMLSLKDMHSHDLHGALEEPVPFEEFQFTFGLDPHMAIPIPNHDALPSSFLAEDDHYLGNLHKYGSHNQSLLDLGQTSILDEHDHKAFTEFLDAFALDQDNDYSHAESIAGQFPNYNDVIPPFSLNAQLPTHSISQPLSTDATTMATASESSRGTYLYGDSAPSTPQPPTSRRASLSRIEKPRSRRDSHRRSRQHKEPLTEEEKRSNHIASEQKRRSTIRSSLKDLTDIVPALNGISHSKSTVLFKATDYINYLERRNRRLQDKLASLEIRLQVQGKTSHHRPPHSSRKASADAWPPWSTSEPPSSFPPTTSAQSTSHTFPSFLRPAAVKPSRSNDYDTTREAHVTREPPKGADAALRAHREQQQQLQAIQEQLHMHAMRTQKRPAGSSLQAMDHWLSPPNEQKTSIAKSTDPASSLSPSSSSPSSATTSATSSALTTHGSAPPSTHSPSRRHSNPNHLMDVDTAEEPLKTTIPA